MHISMTFVQNDNFSKLSAQTNFAASHIMNFLRKTLNN